MIVNLRLLGRPVSELLCSKSAKPVPICHPFDLGSLESQMHHFTLMLQVSQDMKRSSL